MSSDAPPAETQAVMQDAHDAFVESARLEGITDSDGVVDYVMDTQSQWMRLLDASPDDIVKFVKETFPQLNEEEESMAAEKLEVSLMMHKEEFGNDDELKAIMGYVQGHANSGIEWREEEGGFVMNDGRDPMSLMHVQNPAPAHHSYGGPRPPRPCAFFNSSAGCRNGDGCRFSHGAPGGAPAPSPKTTICRFFARGNCQYGDRCFYSHG